jgi:Tol biopolymer transport system component/tRNA A-37 threonylcarbamoyl transferase component Bud32
LTTVDSPVASALRERYHLEQELGRGGMAIVYLAHDLKHDRRVALKIMNPELTGTLGADRFLREIRVTARLEHPNILPVLDSGQSAGFLWYTMPYVEGESLRDRLRREPQLPLGEAVRLIGDVADALGYAHEQRLVHRDVKPENILLSHGHARLADFGVARALEAAGGTAFTGPRIALGTPQYMSPEQAAGEMAGLQSDVYSLACVLYETLAGQPPFTGTTSRAITARHAMDPVPSLRAVRPNVSPALEQVVLTALSKISADRFASGSDFKAALDTVRHDVPFELDPAGPTSGAQPRRILLTERPRRRAVLVLLLSLLAVGGTYLALGPQPRPMSPAPAGSRLRQLTFAGNVAQPEVSPDGKLLAYLEHGDPMRLLVKDLVGGSIIPLAVVGGSESTLRWTPDGSALLYSGLDSARSDAKLLFPRLGGAPRSIQLSGGYIAFSPDGARLATWPQNIERPLYVTTLATGQTRTVDVPVEVGWRRDGAWSPDGRTIALLSNSQVGARWMLWLLDVETGAWREGVADTVLLSPPRWSPSGTALYFLRGGEELCRLRVAMGDGPMAAPEVLYPGVGASEFSLSADGSRFVFARRQTHTNLWLGISAAGRLRFSMRQLTSGTAPKSPGRLSPDGSAVAFVQEDSEGRDVFVLSVDGGTARRISSSGVATEVVPAWSPDGRFIAFVAKVHGRRSLRTIGINGQNERVYQRTDVTEYIVWAPYTRVLYQRPGNRNFHWVDLVTQLEHPLIEDESVGWIFAPRPSSSGSRIAVMYNRRPGPGTHILSSNGKDAVRVGPPMSWPLGWSADETSLYIEDPDGRILRAPTRGGPANVAGRLPPHSSCMLEPVPPSLVLVCSVEESVGDAWMLENFDPEPGGSAHR